MGLFKKKKIAKAEEAEVNNLKLGKSAKAEPTKDTKDKKLTKIQASKAFIDASLAFENTRIDEVLKREKTWQKIAGASLLTAVIMAIAIMFLTPLKEVEPYLVRVDNNTGQTDIVTVLANAESDYGEEVAKFFATNYVRLVEGYDWYTVSTTFKKALLFSSPEEQNRLNNKFASPTAPHKVYKKNKRVEIQIDNVSFIDENLIQVRFTKNIVPTDGGAYNPQDGSVSPNPIVTQGIATIGYDYVNVPEVDEVRLVNPLGFTVYTYKTSEVMNSEPKRAEPPKRVSRPEQNENSVAGGF